MMQTHAMVENYGFSQPYSESLHGMPAMCVNQHSPQKMVVATQQMSPSNADHQNFYLGMTCSGQVSPYRGGSSTMPVLPAKKFRGDQAEILRCKRRVDLTEKLGYKTHPTAVARRNERERNRVKHINSTFATLRNHIPCAAKNKKMSKVETLRSAIRYINHLQQILDSQDEEGESDVLQAVGGPSRGGMKRGGAGAGLRAYNGAGGRPPMVPSPLSSVSSLHSAGSADPPAVPARPAGPFSPPLSPMSPSQSMGSPGSRSDMSPDPGYDTYDQADDGDDLTQFVDWFCEG